MKWRWINTMDFNIVVLVLGTFLSTTLAFNNQSVNGFFDVIGVLSVQPLIMIFTTALYFFSREIKKIKKYSWTITISGLSFSILHAIYGY